MFFPISFYRESRREAEQNTEEEEGYEKIQTWRMEEQNYGEVNGCNNSLQKKTNVCLFPSRLQSFILMFQLDYWLQLPYGGKTHLGAFCKRIQILILMFSIIRYCSCTEVMYDGY